MPAELRTPAFSVQNGINCPETVKPIHGCENTEDQGTVKNMISFLEMALQYPIGAKITVPERNGRTKKQQEIIGYEYYNGTGYLIFRDNQKMDVEKLAGMAGQDLKLR